MSSYEEFRKKKQQSGSYYEFAQKKESPIQVSIPKKQNAPLLQNIKNFADATGKIGENTYKSTENGILSAIQNLGRNMFNLQGRKKEEETFDKINQQILNSRKDLSSEEKNNIINNSSFSQRNLIKGIEEKNQEFQEKKNENVAKIQQNADSISNPVGKYIAGELAPGIGQMLPGMLPGIGTTYFISSATGNYHDDAIQRGMTEDQATIYSGTMGIIEGALESLGANLTKNVGKQLLKKNIKGALVNYGLDIGENFLEESIVEPISEIAAGMYGGKDKADWSNIGQRMLESGVAGALTSAITGGASAMIGGVGSKVTQQNQYVDYNTNKKLNKDSQNWLKQAENIIQENNDTKLAPRLAQNQQNTNTQQITPTIQNNAQNGISEQKNNLNDNAVNENSTNQKLQKALEKNGDFSTQVDKYIKGELPSGDLLYLGNTSKTLQKLGLKNEPLILKQSKLKSMLEYSDNNDRLHGLPAETIKKIPEAINNPLNILKSSTHDNSIVVITDLADSSSRPIIASIEIDYNGQIGDIDFLSNRLTSAYGKNNYDRFMQTEIAKGNLLYDIDEGILKELPATGLQLSKGISSFDESSSFINNSIPQNKNSVKDNTITNNYMQNAENNSGSFKAPINTADMQENVSKDFQTNKNDVDNIATILEKPVEKVKEKDRSWAIIKANLIDKGKVFEELSIKTGNRELQGKWDYTLTSTARGQNAIGHARYELNPNTKTQKQISKSLTDIIDEVGENTADFYSYMYHQLNIDRMTLEEKANKRIKEIKNKYMVEYSNEELQNMVEEELQEWANKKLTYKGRKLHDDTDTKMILELRELKKLVNVKNKPVFGESVTADISRQRVTELENKYPEFKSYAQDVYDYLDANTKELVNNGVISKETQQLFKDMYPHYVPISRVRNKGIAINVPLDTGRTGINSPIKKATGGSSDINPLFETIADRTLQTYRASARNSFGIELKNTINQTNQLKQLAEQTDIDTIMENMTDEEQNKQLLQKGENGENPTFTVFEKGEKVTYEISIDMYDALKPKNELLSKIDENKVSKIANKINNFRRGLLTEYNPVFSLTNAIKDSQDILLYSQHSGKTYVKIPEATAQILSKGYWYNEYIQNGGSQNSYFKDGEFDTTKNNLPTKIKKTITFPLRAISSVNNVIEMTPRLAEYIVSREQGRSIETSMLDAARVTTNFKAGGDITKTLNRNGFTFLNASVQGMQQQIRNIQEANAKGLKGYAILACKYAIAGAPVLLLNNLIWADDEEYEELQDYVKDNYYIIGKLSGGNFLRIPKGRAVATIQKIVSNANEFIKNDSINSDEVGKVFWEDVKNDIKFGIDNLAPNNPIENNILSPIFQVISNKTWYGDDLVPSRLQNKPKEEQYDETTDSFSRWLGEKTKISPIKTNYLINQYSGGAGDVILPMLTPQAENNVLEDKFIANATMKNKYPGEFFAKVDELEINQNSSKATDEDILKYKYISSVSKDIGELYAKKREIQNSSATDKEKKTRLIEVQKQINALAKDSLEEVDKIRNTDLTATIGNEKYYKYKGEWKQLSDKETEKIKGISLNTYANYQNEVATLAEEKKKDDESVSRKDRIKILTNANYTANEKDKIYSQIINKDDETYQILKKLDGSKNIINQYLDYLQADLKADREDDGTEKGKAISGSKKQKVYNYINSIDSKDMSYVQRLYLAGINTTLSTSEKKKLFTYINENKSLTSKEKMEALDKLQGFTVYKNGKVTW